jgi:hypothetical protein
MRFSSSMAVVVFLLILGLVSTVDARGGKGGGGGGGNVSRGGAQKVQRGGQGGAMKHQFAPSHQPAKDKVASGKPTKEKTAKVKSAKDKAAKEKTGDSPEGDGDEAGETPNKKEKQLANFQRQRDKKISQAEHLRQIAEQNGNANLAANADRMEAQALQQYAQKVSHLEKFGVTDPALGLDSAGLDGAGLADPNIPDVSPIDDPVGTLQGLLPLGR